MSVALMMAMLMVLTLDDVCNYQVPNHEPVSYLVGVSFFVVANNFIGHIVILL